MAKDINLTSQEWCDIVFEGKNQNYGAYKIRRGSSNRSIISLIVILGLVVFLAFLPGLIETVKAAVRPPADGLTDTVQIADLKDLEDKPEENLAAAQEAPPPPPMKATIKFTTPEIVESTEVDANEGLFVDKLLDSKLQVSIINNEEGDDEGANPEDLIVREKVTQTETVYEIVDKTPQFIGGESAMMAFVQKNLVYPPAAVEYQIQGTVNVRFVVNSNGKVSFDRVLGKPDKYLMDEAIRVVKLMPNWIPGERDGKKVSSYFIIPIRFVLN